MRGGEPGLRRARPGGVLGCIFYTAFFVVVDWAAPDLFNAP